MNEQITSDSKSLVTEIFQMTGQKVELDDPIVVAALVHSQLIRRAGHDAMTAIQSAVDKILIDLGEAVRSERQAASDIGRATAEAYTQIVSVARAATDAEVPKMHAQFVNIAQDVLQQVRKEASAAAPYGWKIKAALSAAGLVLLGGLAGGIIGASWFGKAAPPDVETSKRIEAGRDFIQALPQLDVATREKIVRQIQKNREAAGN